MTSTRPARHARSHETLAVYVPLGVLVVALFVTGIMFLGERWAAVCLGAGTLAATVIGLCAVFHRTMEAVYGVLLVLAAGMITAGALMSSVILTGLGVLALSVVGASAPIAVILARGRGAESAGAAPADAELYDLLRRIHENSMLSENAKRVLFRERELGMLRNTIEADIAAGEYNAAIILCHEMADVFGYREEAEAFRQRIERSRQEHYEHDVRSALGVFDELLLRHDWAAVHHEAARISRLYGDSHLVQDLQPRITAAREGHKQELEGQFLEAAKREDVETAMALLKQLDRYLDRDGAERLSEVAQGVVSRHRDNLGVQFKMAVNDRRWAEAARIGEVIVGEFPNTKMADEVRSMIDVLRTKATQAALSAPQ